MTRTPWHRVALPVVLAGLTCSAPAQIIEGAKIGKFKVPEYDGDNLLKSLLFGEYAEVQPDGSVDITELKLEFYEGGTNVQMTVTAPRCTYDRRKGVARSESTVRIEGEQMTVTGEDFTFDVEKERFQIRQDARVEIRNARKRMDVSKKAEEKEE